MTLVDLLADHADWDGSAPALRDGTDEMTYDALRTGMADVAASLRSLGVQPGDRVGVHLRKSVHSFVSVHGVLRAGAVMVPLDSFAPVEHTASVIDDAGVRVVITDASVANLARLADATGLTGAIVRGDHTDGADVVEVRTVAWTDMVGAAGDRNAADVAPGDPAYIIYTSGSTGRPKGIVHTHRSALAYARLAADAYGLCAADRLANIASLHFDQSTFELYAAPLVGASVTVVPDAVLRFPANLSEVIEADAITVWYSVPYVLRQLVDRGGLEQRDLGSVRWVLYGGESYPPAELGALMANTPNAMVSNVYGPAEVNQCTRYDLTAAPSLDQQVPIGQAWDDTELVVVDADLTPVDGVPGELLVATTTMMDRYWNRPDLTEAAIVEREYPGCERTRWYRTGDLVDTTENGDFVFLGRADNQVKIRGQRVELEAIDLTIRELDGIVEVAVVADDIDGLGETSLIAVVEAADAVSLRDVQRAVAARHPRVAVPVQLVIIDRLARTATGKVDRNAARSQARAHVKG